MSTPFNSQLRWAVQKGQGKTGKDIRGTWDPIRGRYVYPESGTVPEAKGDFVVDRAAHKQRDFMMQQRGERKGNKPYDQDTTQERERAEESSGMGTVTSTPEQQGTPRDTMEHIEGLQDQAQKELSQAAELQDLDLEDIDLVTEGMAAPDKKESGKKKKQGKEDDTKDEEDADADVQNDPSVAADDTPQRKTPTKDAKTKKSVQILSGYLSK